MLKKRVIPCLDVDKGRVVKGVRFTELIDAGDPVAQAAHYDRAGADELVFLDITASIEGRGTMLSVVRAVAAQCFMPLTVGGGVGSCDDVHALLQAGADKAAMNSAAVKSPQLIEEASHKFGAQCIVLAIDAKRTDNATIASGFEVFIHGGRTPTGMDALTWAKQGVARGAGEILLTSMDRDGTKEGYDVELTACISAHVPVPVIASGGAGGAAHLVEVLTQGKADAALAASIFHFRETAIRDIKQQLKQENIPVRLEE